MIQKWWGVSAAAAAWLGVLGCAASGDDGTQSNALTDGPCVPHQSAPCTCPDGTPASRMCAADGSSYGLCLCFPGADGASGGQPAAGTNAPLGGMMATVPPAGSGGMGATMVPMAGTAAPAAGTGGMGSAGAGMSMAGGGSMQAGTGGTTMPGEEVPATDYCAPVASWDPMWTQWEDEVLVLVNEYRAMGFNCDTQGQFGSAGPLTMHPHLRCSARLHSQDMAMRMYFAHESPDGTGPGSRMDAAGYKGGTWGENIAMGQRSPQQVVDGWMQSDGHCRNIMSPQFTEIGVGFFQGGGRSSYYWTQNFGAPCAGPWCM